MIMFLPSSLGDCSTIPSSSMSAIMRSRTFIPSSEWAISRPRNIIVTLALFFVLFCFGADFDFLHLNGGLLLLGLLRFLGLQVFVLAIVHYFAYRGRCFGSHLHQIKFFFRGASQCFFQWHDPQLATVLTNETDLGGPNLVVDVNLLDYFPFLLSEIKLLLFLVCKKYTTFLKSAYGNCASDSNHAGGLPLAHG